jgi:hypothetical protein
MRAGAGSFRKAADYRLRKSVEGLTLEIGINRNPPVRGKNDVRIEIRTPEGKPVSKAEVTVNYCMPPMPRMPPMNYAVCVTPVANRGVPLPGASFRPGEAVASGAVVFLIIMTLHILGHFELQI